MLQKCKAVKPLLAKELTDGDQGPLHGTGMQRRGLYGPVKDQQTQTSDTFNFKQQLTPLGTPKDRSVCLAEGGEK